MYQVWTKSEYEGFTRKDCVDLAIAQLEILAALKKGLTPLLTVEVPFSIEVQIKEVPKVEAAKVETIADQSSRAESQSEV
jgi:hypothetical protein